MRKITCALGVVMLCRLAGAVDFDPGGLTLMRIKPLAERKAAPADVSVTAYPMGVVEVEPAFHLVAGTPANIRAALHARFDALAETLDEQERRDELVVPFLDRACRPQRARHPGVPVENRTLARSTMGIHPF